MLTACCLIGDVGQPGRRQRERCHRHRRRRRRSLRKGCQRSVGAKILGRLGIRQRRHDGVPVFDVDALRGQQLEDLAGVGLHERRTASGDHARPDTTHDGGAQRWRRRNSPFGNDRRHHVGRRLPQCRQFAADPFGLLEGLVAQAHRQLFRFLPACGRTAQSLGQLGLRLGRRLVVVGDLLLLPRRQVFAAIGLALGGFDVG